MVLAFLHPACHLRFGVGFGVLSVTDHTVIGNKAIHSVSATLNNAIFGVLQEEMCKCVLSTGWDKNGFFNERGGEETVLSGERTQQRTRPATALGTVECPSVSLRFT